MSRLLSIIALAMIMATVVVSADSLINYKCSDAACSVGCVAHQTLPVGRCFQVAGGTYAVVQVPGIAPSQITTVQYNDASCTASIGTSTDPLGSKVAGSCKGGAGASFYLDYSASAVSTIPSAPIGSKNSILTSNSAGKALRHVSKLGQTKYQRHNVFFRYTDSTTPDIQQQIDAKYRAIARSSPYVVSIEGGVPNSPEGFQQQMQVAYLTTFSTTQDRDFFVGRPFNYPYDLHHDAFKAFVGPHLYLPIQQGLVVLDFVDA